MLESLVSALICISPSAICLAIFYVLFQAGHPYIAAPFFALAGMGACYVG